MPIKAKKLEQTLIGKLGFSPAPARSPDHKWYQLEIPGSPIIATKISHGEKEISAKLEGMIARQLRVKRAFLIELVSCTKSSEEYRDQVTANPYPPSEIGF
ncbi:hypothetical protein [Caldilinea sp.]|uniref:hypothetical protein n=1 Tax=Caldilinea sp. TaxID=2293560 RepID=UPI002CB327AB|nr:hypothetical protein [Anaerolineales bacterium]HQY90532.1 hypothetical protein [Caldilinea sp.]HRA66485.1 hypothetical protein [Caldilinea sp.]